MYLLIKQLFSILLDFFFLCPGLSPALSPALNYWSFLINTVHADRELCMSNIDQTTDSYAGGVHESHSVESVARGFAAGGVREATFPAPALLSEFCCGYPLDILRFCERWGGFGSHISPPRQSLDSCPQWDNLCSEAGILWEKYNAIM